MLQRCRLQTHDLVEVGAMKQLRLARAIEDVREVCSLLFAQMDLNSRTQLGQQNTAVSVPVQRAEKLLQVQAVPSEHSVNMCQKAHRFLAAAVAVAPDEFIDVDPAVVPCVQQSYDLLGPVLRKVDLQRPKSRLELSG